MSGTALRGVDVCNMFCRWSLLSDTESVQRAATGNRSHLSVHFLVLNSTIPAVHH